MTAPYDHEALWLKAKLFTNRAMDDGDLRSADEKSLWAALALELLAKSALARVSPLLIAEPSEDGTNILIASGLIKGDARFISMRAQTIFKRCQKAFKPFSLDEATAITNARNEYLHSSGIGFMAIPQSAWWPRFWAQACILIAALDKEIEEFVGVDREDTVQDFLRQNKRNVEHRTETLIERAKQRLLQYQEGTLSARVAADWKPGHDRTAGLMHHAAATCPACSTEGVLEGDDVFDTAVEPINDYDAEVILSVAAEYFSCPNCQLVLDGPELIDQAELPGEFTVTGDLGDMEPDYGND
jgi:hypothetical protein